MEKKERAIVYVDALNFYNRLLKFFYTRLLKDGKDATGIRWLDLLSLFENLFPDLDIIKIKYFTAKLSDKINKGSSGRQKAYISALQGHGRGKFECIKGHFIIVEKWSRLSDREKTPGNSPSRSVLVKKPEEKETDVNLALEMLKDAAGLSGIEYEIAIIVSNDSDFKPCMKEARKYGKKVIWVPPTTRERGRDFKETSWKRFKKGEHYDERRIPKNKKPFIDEDIIRKHQLPNPVISASGKKHFKPKKW